MILFSAERLTMVFGGLTAVDDFSLELNGGDLTGLIGPNGAGKTTVFNMITGSLKPTQGKIVFQGEEMTGWKPNAITRRGIARTFQNIRLFQDLPVIENVMISFHGRLRSSFMGAVLRTPLYNREEKEMTDQAMALLRQVHLAEVANERAGALAYGQQRRLEMARALAANPKLLLLDEPAAGMNPQETRELMDFILKIKEDFRVTVLLIEHDMRVVMGICQWIKVLDHGATIAEGTPKEIQNNPDVIAAYLEKREEKALLEVLDLSVFYGGIHALKGISLRVPEGEIVTLIGANGAGKSTVLRTISGLVEARQGKILFRGREIQNRPAHRIVQEGIAMVPEGRRVFVNLSVEENLLMGAYSRKDGEEIRRSMEWVFRHFPRLKERPRQKGGTLSGGEQQMLALGRGLMSRPDLLMLDEPSLGLAPKLVKEVFDMIQNIHAEGTTILLIEQNAMAALEVAAHGYVLQTGQIITEGGGKDLLKDPTVKEAYLGEGLK